MSTTTTIYPYVSQFNQIWKDVILVRIENWDINKTFSEIFQSIEKIDINEAVKKKGVYFCIACRTDQTSTPLENIGGVKKCIGSNPPSGFFLEKLFSDDFKGRRDFRFSRIQNASTETAFSYTHRHKSVCGAASKCCFRNLQSSKPILFLRFHLKPVKYEALSEVKFHDEKDRGTIVVEKPIGLPSEAHVSNGTDCLAKLALGDKFRPLHRLDCWVGGLVLISNENPVRRRIVSKSYKALVVRNKEHNPKEGLVEVWMPPCSLFHRPFPLPISKTPYDGWLSCKLEITGFRDFKLNSTQWINKNLIEIDIRLITGRRHQIRATLAFLNLPIVNDVYYQIPIEITSSESLKELEMISKEEFRIHEMKVEELIQTLQERGSASDFDIEIACSKKAPPSHPILKAMDEIREKRISAPIGLYATQLEVEDIVTSKIDFYETLPWWREKEIEINQSIIQGNPCNGR